MTALTEAIRTAWNHTALYRSITREECQRPFVVVRKDCGRYAIYNERAWSCPVQAPLLRWAPPTGERIVRVNLDGSLERLA